MYFQTLNARKPDGTMHAHTCVHVYTYVYTHAGEERDVPKGIPGDLLERPKHRRRRSLGVGARPKEASHHDEQRRVALYVSYIWWVLWHSVALCVFLWRVVGLCDALRRSLLSCGARHARTSRSSCVVHTSSRSCSYICMYACNDIWSYV